MKNPLGYTCFSEAVMNVSALDGNQPVLVAQTAPAALDACGMGGLPVLTTVSHIKKELLPQHAGGHGIDPGTLAVLPDLMSEPVAAWRPADPGRAVVLLDATDAFGDPLIAAVAVATRADRGNRAIGVRRGDEVNYVLSVYGRMRALGEAVRAAKDGSLLLLDRKKYESLCSRVDAYSGMAA